MPSCVLEWKGKHCCIAITAAYQAARHAFFQRRASWVITWVLSHNNQILSHSHYIEFENTTDTTQTLTGFLSYCYYVKSHKSWRLVLRVAASWFNLSISFVGGFIEDFIQDQESEQWRWAYCHNKLLSSCLLIVNNSIVIQQKVEPEFRPLRLRCDWKFVNFSLCLVLVNFH